MRRSRALLAGILALAIGAAMGFAFTGVASAKKGGRTATVTTPVNQQIPDATATANGMLTSTVSLGKKFKGSVIRDVNVTLQTTGSAPTAARQIDARLTAPNGMTTWLIGHQLAGQSIGPLTLDDQSPNDLGGAVQRDPTTLASPYAGTAQPDCFNSFGVCTFWPMNGGPSAGAWTLRVYDVSSANPATSLLNFWQLRVVTGKPYLAK